MPVKNKKKLIRKIFGWTSFGLGIAGSVVLIVNSCFPGGLSGAISSFIFINTADALNPSHTAPTVPVTGVSLSFTNSNLNNIDGYEQNEIPVGCTKVLKFAVEPSDATNTDFTYSCTSENVVFTREGSTLYVQPNAVENFEIEFTSKDGNFKKTQEIKAVDLKAPQNFNIETKSIEIINGESFRFEPEYLSTYLSDPLMSVRYYDDSKLTFESSNNSVVEANPSGYLVSKSVGNSTVTVSNGTISKTLSVSVVANENPIVEPTSLEVNADTTSLGIQDLDFDRSPKEGECYHAHISLDWGENDPTDKAVTYSSSNPLVAKVDNDGNVRGYRKEGTSTITIASVRNPSLSKTIEFTTSSVAISDFTISENNLADLTVGKNRYIQPTFSPRNATDQTFLAESDNPSIVKAVSAGRSINVSAVSEGTATITVYPKSNPSLKKTFALKTVPYSISDNPSYNEYHSTFRKVTGHLSAFAITGLFLTLGLVLLFADYGKLHYFLYLISSFYGLFLASFTEFIQTIIPGRNGDFQDVLIDSGGYFIGVIIILAIFGTIQLVKFIQRKVKK